MRGAEPLTFCGFSSGEVRSASYWALLCGVCSREVAAFCVVLGAIVRVLLEGGPLCVVLGAIVLVSICFVFWCDSCVFGFSKRDSGVSKRAARTLGGSLFHHPLEVEARRLVSIRESQNHHKTITKPS